VFRELLLQQARTISILKIEGATINDCKEEITRPGFSAPRQVMLSAINTQQPHAKQHCQ
jgi:hypothetical protein